MKYNRFLNLILSVTILSSFTPIKPVSAASSRMVEYLGRGGYGIATDSGVYLSWRLLGTEAINQTFDIYRSNILIAADIDSTNYIDIEGKVNDLYRIVPHGMDGIENDIFAASDKNYKDIVLSKPDSGDGYSYEFNDVSVGDVDNDGEFEFIVKWDPTNAKDNSQSGFTGNVYIDCYKQNGALLWRIDLGKNIRAGSHYTQFIVYDFDCDGKAEMAVRTAPGAKDGLGDYVSKAASSISGEPLTWTDASTGETYNDEDDLRDIYGKISTGPDWLTMFDGSSGKALQTVNYFPQRGNASDWGDDTANRSERFNMCAAYLDGEHPSLITARGYYMRAAMSAYDWNGKSFSICWQRDDKGKGIANGTKAESVRANMNGTLYGNGNHQISVCDADNDGKDEIVFGSTVVDDDGNILNSTNHGHGDALHVSDFNNDGKQEIFQVHEESFGFKKFGAEIRSAADASIIGSIGASADVGRGLMDNFDDSINDEGEFFSSADNNTYNMSGTKLGIAPNINPSFAVWWDGDLSRELLSGTTVSKYDVSTGTKSNLLILPMVHAGTKDGPALAADLLGDWREELCYPTEDNGTLRIFMTTDATDYKIPTLMHDTQYREAIAWQNVGYNQPPHPKFYVGKAALAANKKYLSPETGFDTVTPAGNEPTMTAPLPEDIPDDSFTVTVNAVGDADKLLHTYEGIPYKTTVSFAYPKYILENGFAYEADIGKYGTYYGGSIANVIKNEAIEINYTKKYGGVVYLDDLDYDIDKSANIRASNCLALSNAQYTSEYKLQPGTSYTILLRYYNAGRGTCFILGDKMIHSVSAEDAIKPGNWGEYTVSGVTVDVESSLSTISENGISYDPLDIVLIIDESAIPAHLELLNNFKEDLRIETKRDDNVVQLTLTMRDGIKMPDLMLYSVIYNESGNIQDISSTKYFFNNGSLTIPLSKPHVPFDGRYKLMLWDSNMQPVIEPITDKTNGFFEPKE